MEQVQSAASGFHRTPVTIPGGHHFILNVHLKGHTWVAIARDGAVLVREDAPVPTAAFVLESGLHEILSDGSIESFDYVPMPEPANDSEAKARASILLELTDDAKDRHPVDQIGMLVADGQSFCTITIQAISPDGRPSTLDGPTVFLRCTGGRLRTEKNHNFTRSVDLKGGKATIRFVSDNTPKVVTVTALAQDVQGPATIEFEFVAPY